MDGLVAVEGSFEFLVSSLSLTMGSNREGLYIEERPVVAPMVAWWNWNAFQFGKLEEMGDLTEAANNCSNKSYDPKQADQRPDVVSRTRCNPLRTASTSTTNCSFVSGGMTIGAEVKWKRCFCRRNPPKLRNLNELASGWQVLATLGPLFTLAGSGHLYLSFWRKTLRRCPWCPAEFVYMGLSECKRKKPLRRSLSCQFLSVQVLSEKLW